MHTRVCPISHCAHHGRWVEGASEARVEWVEVCARVCACVYLCAHTRVCVGVYSTLVRRDPNSWFFGSLPRTRVVFTDRTPDLACYTAVVVGWHLWSECDRIKFLFAFCLSREGRAKGGGDTLDKIF